jgi:hypothetical protein
MLLDPYSRFFVRHQLQFRSCRNQGLPLPFRSGNDTLDVENALHGAIADGTAQTILQNHDVVRLTRMDVRADDNIVVLLFRRTDPDASTPIVENLDTRTLRPLDKQENDAMAVSAHLFIELGSIEGAIHPTYRAILEEVPGLGRTYVNHIFADVLRKLKYDYTDHRGDVKETYTIVDFHGIKSETIGNALRGAAMPYVELVRPGTVGGLDSEGLVIPRQQRMKLMLRATPAQTLPLLGRIKDWAFGEDWTDVLVRVDLPENRSRMVTLAREIDAADVLFVRSEEINVSQPLDVCTETINEELVAKAKGMFADAAGWR